MNCGVIIFLTYCTLEIVHAQPSGTRQHSEILYGNSEGVKTSGHFGFGGRTQNQNFPNDSHKKQSILRRGGQSQGITRHPGTKYYSTQYFSNGYDPSIEFPRASFPQNQYHPIENSYGSEYSNQEYYPVADPCGSEYSNYEYYPTQNTIHREAPSYISVNQPYLKGHSYDSGLNIWTSPNGVKASRSTGFDYKMDLKF